MPESSVVRLYISGMTCASCAAQIEKKLGERGISASVNFATGSALLRGTLGFTQQKAIDAVKAIGYTATPQKAVRSREESVTLWRLLLSVILAIPVVAISMSLSMFPGPLLSLIPSTLFWNFVVFVFATPVVTWSAWPFHKACIKQLIHFGATMDTLISLGVGITYIWSTSVLVSSALSSESTEGWLYFEAAVSIVVFTSVGRFLETRAKAKQGLALDSLVKLEPKTATLANTLESVPTETLAVGDRIVIYPGERVPADAKVIEGGSDLDISFLTGNSIPVPVSPGDTLASGAMNMSGNLTAEVIRVGSDTELSRLAALVQSAQKPKFARIVDRVSGIFVPTVLILSLITLFVHWGLTGNPADSISAAVAVLVIACPCALGLATPMAVLSGTLRGLQLGILIRSSGALEVRPNTIVLDKTGTLTDSKVSLHRVISLSEGERDGVLCLSASLESGSEHPLARAVVAAAQNQGLALEKFSDFKNYPGFGVRGKVAGHDVLVGRPLWVRETLGAIHTPEQDIPGATAVAWGGRIRGFLVFDSAMKTSSPKAVALFLKMKLGVILATGDSKLAAENAAKECGIKTVISEAKPGDKLELVRRLRADGQRVAMVGDGINDAAALAAADLGVAMASGTDLAFDTSDIAIMSNDLLDVVDGIRLTNRTRRTVKQNLFWAFIYNTAGIPIAATGLLNPMIASLAMALSSLCVVTNSIRLRRFRPTPR